jgi:hypothetical protein
MARSSRHGISIPLDTKESAAVLEMYYYVPQFKEALTTLGGYLFANDFELELKGLFLELFEKNEDTDRMLTEEFYAFANDALVYIILFGIVPYGRKLCNRRWHPYVPGLGMGHVEFYFEKDMERRWIWKWDPVVMRTMNSDIVSQFVAEGDPRIRIWCAPMYTPQPSGRLNSIASSCIDDFMIVRKYIENMFRSHERQLHSNLMFRKLMPKLDNDEQLRTYQKYKMNLAREELHARWQDEKNRKLAGFRRMYNTTDPAQAPNNYLGPPYDETYDYDEAVLRDMRESITLSHAYQGDTSVVGNVMGSLMEMHQLRVDPVDYHPLVEAVRRLDNIIHRVLGLGSMSTNGRVLHETASTTKGAMNSYLIKMANDISTITTLAFQLVCQEENRYLARLLRENNIMPDVDFEHIFSSVKIKLDPLTIVSETFTSAIIEATKNMDPATALDMLFAVTKVTSGVDLKRKIQLFHKQQSAMLRPDPKTRQQLELIMDEHDTSTDPRIHRPPPKNKHAYFDELYRKKRRGGTLDQETASDNDSDTDFAEAPLKKRRQTPDYDSDSKTPQKEPTRRHDFESILENTLQNSNSHQYRAHALSGKTLHFTKTPKLK